jgi:hypothetical protein
MAITGRLVIVASCTLGKTGDIPKALRFRRYARAQKTAAGRIDAWRNALDSYEVETAAAVERYAGGFWSVARELPALARERGMAATFLVASAGYGLVSSRAQLKPYSATFTKGADSVVADHLDRDSHDRELQAWWRCLSSWGGPPGHRGPRSLEQVARRSPGSSVLVIASPVYVRAMADDLHLAAQALRRPESLVIVSSVSGFPDELTDHLVPSIAVLQSRLGGALGSLHARTARDLLRGAQLPLDASMLKTQYERIATHSHKRVAPSRERRTDSDVRAFIRARLNGTASESCTSLLRALRSSGFKCEQKRFRGLFDEVNRS